jgi:hypothetical protein
MSPPKPPDPHKFAHLLLTPLTPWGFRIPLYAALLAAGAVVLWLTVGSVVAGSRESAAMARLQEDLQVMRKQDAVVLALQNAAHQHLQQGAHQQQAAAVQLVSADSFARVAQQAAVALQAAKTASDSVGTLLKVNGALAGDTVSLRGAVREQQGATASALAAYRDVRIEADTVERANKQLRADAAAVVREAGCHLISLHPCLRNVHLGVGPGYGLTQHGGTVYAGGQLTLAVVWSP